MKYVKFPFSVLMDSRLSANDMRVLGTLIYRSNLDDNNNCWPSIRTISKDTGIHQKKISGHTKRLVDFGWIEKIPRGKGGVGNNQNYHVISTPTLGEEIVPPLGGSKYPHSGTPNTPTLGGYTPLYKEKRKEKIKERGNNEKFLKFSSRERSVADDKKTRALLDRLLNKEKQQEHASA